MSEAYEIGVTLALGDGVSAGIAQARRDTAQLERVLQAGGVSVQQLRAASVAALSVIRAVPVVEKAVGKEPALAPLEESAPAMVRREEATPAVARVEAAQPAPAAWPPVRHAAPPAAVTAPPVVAPRQGPPAAVPDGPVTAQAPMVVAGDAPVEAPWSEPGAPAQQTSRATPAGAPQSVQVSAPISLAAIGAAARDEQPAPLPVALGSGPAQEIVVPPADAPATVRPALQAPDPDGVVGAAPRAWEQVVQSAWAVPAGDDAAGVPARAGPLPPATAPDRAPVGSQTATEAGATAQAPAAPPAAAAPGPTEGDVYLDGALVGRWISRFLTQEAGRASAGPTGFDPRRGRVLPGATVGG